jgi:hypothetical protein
VTILGGHPDTAAFQDKMKSYGYAEESYLGFTVFSGIPQNVINTYPSLSNLLPRAYGVIDGVKVDGDALNLILIADNWSGNKEVLQSKNAIEAALESYQKKTAFGFKNSEISALANSLGEVGSAFILSESEFERMYRELSAEGKDRVKSNVAPIDLGAYKLWRSLSRRVVMIRSWNSS